MAVIGWHRTWRLDSQEFGREGLDVKPMAAALTGALISGVGMYAIGTHAQDRFAVNPALAGNPAMSYYAAAPQPLAANRKDREPHTPGPFFVRIGSFGSFRSECRGKFQEYARAFVAPRRRIEPQEHPVVRARPDPQSIRHLWLEWIDALPVVRD